MALSSFLNHPGNELAAAVIERIADGETMGFSPLLIAGPTGSGKSRLLKKLAEEYSRIAPDALVTDTDGSTIRQWVDEIRKRDRGSWSGAVDDGRRFRAFPDDESSITEYFELRTILREADLVIVDRLEALKDQFRAQEELERAIDAMGYTGKALVMATAAVPKADDGWNQRFLSQLGGGLIVEISMPEEHARRRFVMEWTAENRFPMPAESLDRFVVAEADFGTIRGRLERLMLMARVDRRPIAALVEEEIERAERESPGADREAGRSPAEISRIVARSFGVRTADLKSADRHPGVVLPRHVAIWLCDRYSTMSRNQIGKYFAGRDAATIRHAIRRVDSLRVSDLGFDERLAELEASVAGR